MLLMRGIRSRGLVLSMNKWVQSWSQQKRFGFCQRPVLFVDECLLGEMGSTSDSRVVVTLKIHIVK